VTTETYGPTESTSSLLEQVTSILRANPIEISAQRIVELIENREAGRRESERTKKARWRSRLRQQLTPVLTLTAPEPPAPKKTKAPRKRGFVCPNDWAPKPQHYEEGVKLGLDMQGVLDLGEEMRRWSQANANREVALKLNWDQAFFNWMRRPRNAYGRGPNKPSSRYGSVGDALRKLSAEGFTGLRRPGVDEDANGVPLRPVQK